MSLMLNRFAKAASFLVLLAACGANDAGAGGKGGRGNASGDGNENPSDGTGGQGSDWSDDGADAGSNPNVDPDAACATTSMESKVVPPAVVFQLDTSGSMNCLPTENEDGCDASPKAGSRWEILKQALKDAIPSIPNQAVVGLMRYPAAAFLPPVSCVASDLLLPPAALDSSQASKFSSALDPIKPERGTPTHDAMAAALAELQKLPAGNKYIVLATDGAANFCLGCNAFCLDQNADNQQMIQAVAQVRQTENISTFVIGVPGSQGFRKVLSEMAKAGGTAKPGCGTDDCHFDMTTSPENFGDAIADVLGQISQQLLGCVYEIPEQDGSFDPSEVNVRFSEGGSSQDIPRDPAHQDGWDYSSDGKKIELFGPACEQVKASQQGRIDILFGCPTVVR